MKFFIFILFFTASFIFVSGQQTLKGKVIDVTTDKALSAVSFYINNSSIGTTTNENGIFAISNINASRFDLIISCIGYETSSMAVLPENLLQTIEIILKQKSAEMESILIQSYEKDGWSKWGKTFTDNIIGIGSNTSHCEITNTDAVKFIYDKKWQILRAYTSEPLGIKNKHLGYELVYGLQTFTTNFKSKMIFFSGYPFLKI